MMTIVAAGRRNASARRSETAISLNAERFLQSRTIAHAKSVNSTVNIGLRKTKNTNAHTPAPMPGVSASPSQYNLGGSSEQARLNPNTASKAIDKTNNNSEVSIMAHGSHETGLIRYRRHRLWTGPPEQLQVAHPRSPQEPLACSVCPGPEPTESGRTGTA